MRLEKIFCTNKRIELNFLSGEVCYSPNRWGQWARYYASDRLILRERISTVRFTAQEYKEKTADLVTEFLKLRGVQVRDDLSMLQSELTINLEKSKMWRVEITCSGEAWKRYGADFKTMIGKYDNELISSKKMPNELRIMAYKIEDVSEAESFVEDCTKFSGFTANFESL